MGLIVVYKVTVPLPDIFSFLLATPTPFLIMEHFFILQNKCFIIEIDTFKERSLIVIQ